MERETQKTGAQTTVRILEKTKRRLRKVAWKTSDIENRRVTELEVAEKLLNGGLPILGQQLGIKPDAA